MLKARGLKVGVQKFDPYINVDPGTMSPFQHGEVFVTEDGAETDLDIAGYGVQYVARGILGGLRRFHGLSSIHLGDGVIRLVLALPLLFLVSKDVAAVALAAAGIGGALGPLWNCRAKIGSLRGGRSDERFHISAALRFAAPAGVIAGSDQLLVNGAPLLVI